MLFGGSPECNAVHATTRARVTDDRLFEAMASYLIADRDDRVSAHDLMSCVASHLKPRNRSRVGKVEMLIEPRFAGRGRRRRAEPFRDEAHVTGVRRSPTV